MSAPVLAAVGVGCGRLGRVFRDVSTLDGVGESGWDWGGESLSLTVEESAGRIIFTLS